MASLDDILPKSFVINIKGVELECRPPKLSHVMLLAKTSKVFQDLDNASVEQIQEVQKTVDAVFEYLYHSFLHTVPLLLQAMLLNHIHYRF